MTASISSPQSARATNRQDVDVIVIAGAVSAKSSPTEPVLSAICSATPSDSDPVHLSV